MPEHPVRGRTILVVEDDLEVGSVLVDLLTLEGHRVETVANGTIALEKLRERTYEIILSDVRMPILDGPSLYREVVRSHPELRHRFVFVTGSGLEPEIRQFLEQTAAPILHKPFGIDDVRRVIREALEAPR